MKPETADPGRAAPPSAWLKPLAPSEPGLTRVLCFPHSGGAAGAFRPLAAELRGALQVLGVQYPGRQDRHHEPVLTDLHELADRIAENLPRSPEPCVFFGHSMGAILAYEVAQRLGDAGPAALVASARPAPSVVEVTTSHLLDDEGLAAHVVRLGGTAAAVLEHPEMRALLLPLIRGDYRASETYRPRGDGPLRCPIIAVGGTEDPVTSAADLQAWSVHTTGPFHLERLPGNHFYLSNHWPAIAGLLHRAASPGTTRFRGRSSFAALTGIETPRLILRPLREQDRQAMVALHTDPRTNRFQPDPPDEAQASELVDTWLAHWAEHGFGYCAVLDRRTRQVIGLTGVRVRDFHGEEVLNLGYRFHPDVWGHGYAVEAARAILDWRARELPSVPVVASVNVANEPSIAVAERIGFTEYTEEFYDGAPSRHYRL
ncbi:GNAT family N-acetyltransferase [Amycolatopsis sp. NPDC004747]